MVQMYQQLSYSNGKIVVQRKSHSDPRGPIMKKRVLKKFEILENKLQDYLKEFVKYTESCKKPIFKQVTVKRSRLPVPVAPVTKRPKIKEKPSVPEETSQTKENEDEKREKLFPSALEKKISEIERKTMNIQRYNKILEDSLKKNKVESDSQDAVLIDLQIKETIFSEVKRLEEILMEKRLEDQHVHAKDIPRYENCQKMLHECIQMLTEAMTDEKKQMKKKSSVKAAEDEKKKHLDDIGSASSSKRFNTSKDSFDFEGFPSNTNKESEVLLKTTEPREVEHDYSYDNDESHYSLYYKDDRRGFFPTIPEFGEDEETERVKTEKKMYYKLPQRKFEERPKYIPTDRNKLFQLQEELNNIEHNNIRVMRVIKGLKKNFKSRDMNEDAIETNEFTEEFNQIQQVNSDFERSNRHVEYLIRDIRRGSSNF